MKTRAAVLSVMGTSAPYATSKPLTIEELELDLPGPGEVLLRIKAAGLCHSDLSVINGDRPRPLPMALGHEAAGIVEGPWCTDQRDGRTGPNPPFRFTRYGRTPGGRAPASGSGHGRQW
jgi:hypothetical protein